ncbi:MAG: hypothetical protein ACLU9S_17785, partial [Oscillospiraceae bacterium]
SSTKGSVGQSYLEHKHHADLYCTAANDQTGVYTWEKPKGGGVAPQLEVSCCHRIGYHLYERRDYC